MKRLLELSAFLLICFCIPLLFYHSENSMTEKEISKNENDIISSLEKTMIRLLRTQQNEVIELPLEEYVKGVLAAEMPASFELEALKAQAIVARTYTMYQMEHHLDKHENADICDDIFCCQAYKTKEDAFSSGNEEEERKWRKIHEAVNQTSGKYITYEGEVIEAFFHAHSGGKTEDVKYVWNGEKIPYLQSVEGMEEEAFLDEKCIEKTKLKELIASLVPSYDANKDTITIIDKTPSGRVYHLKIGDVIVKAEKLRRCIDIRSTYFTIEEDEKTITFHTNGYGHGVGMSQYGANQMAKEGKTAEDIICHYFNNVTIVSSSH